MTEMLNYEAKKEDYRQKIAQGNCQEIHQDLQGPRSIETKTALKNLFTQAIREGNQTAVTHMLDRIDMNFLDSSAARHNAVDMAFTHKQLGMVKFLHDHLGLSIENPRLFEFAVYKQLPEYFLFLYERGVPLPSHTRLLNAAVYTGAVPMLSLLSRCGVTEITDDAVIGNALYDAAVRNSTEFLLELCTRFDVKFQCRTMEPQSEYGDSVTLLSIFLQAVSVDNYSLLAFAKTHLKMRFAIEYEDDMCSAYSRLLEGAIECSSPDMFRFLLEDLGINAEDGTDPSCDDLIKIISRVSDFILRNEFWSSLAPHLTEFYLEDCVCRLEVPYLSELAATHHQLNLHKKHHPL